MRQGEYAVIGEKVDPAWDIERTYVREFPAPSADEARRIAGQEHQDLIHLRLYMRIE